MDSLQLTIRKNGKDEIYVTDTYKVPFKTTKKLMGLLDIDIKENYSTIEAVDLMKKLAGVVEQIEPLILWVFPELTAEDLEEGGDTQEIIEVACKIMLFTLKNCFSNLKNVIKVK